MREQEFITDALVHRAHVGSSDPNDVWHVRDDTTRKLRSRRNEVVLSQAQPVVMNPGDAKASYLYTTTKSGQRFRDLPGHHYAYLQGRVVPALPANIDQGRQLWFKGGQFIYADTKEPFVSADYVRFAPDRSVVAYNTAQINEALHFVRPGELRGSYTDQEMVSMGFRRSQNGAWYIDQRRWDMLVQQGKLREQHGVTENSSQPTFYVSSNDNFATAFEVEMVIGTDNAGFFSYQYFPKTNDVENDVDIHSDQYRGQGYGKMLLLKAIETAQEHNLPFKTDRNGVTPEQGHVYKSLLADRIIRMNPDKTITTTGRSLPGAQDVEENFADGKVKGKSRPGRVKRAGASCSGSVTDLRARAKKYGGEKGKMYHWCANMKSGRKKNK